ncbi:MAG: tetratricopeptide repeat protein [Pirellulaceae bacterium]|nr:tetratricopeptide repeat protein [Pirellulaceae bacterium]
MSEKIELENEAETLRVDGKYQDAADKLNKALEIDPDFVRAHLALAVVYFRLKDADKSCYHGKKAVELEPDDVFNYTALSVTYQRAWQLTQDNKYIQLAEETKAKSDSM